MITDGFTLFATISAVVAFAYWAGTHSRFARHLGAVQITILSGLILGNLGLVTADDAVYDPVVGHLIPLSIALLLFRLDFRELRKIKANMIGYFLLGCFGSFIGALVAVALFGHRIGLDSIRLAGQLAASYIGGGENAVAVAEAIGLRHDNLQLFSASFAADNILTAVWMMIALAAPYGLSRLFSNELDHDAIEAAQEMNRKPFTSADILPSAFYSLATAGVIVVAGRWCAAPLRAWAHTAGYTALDFNTSILWITTFALIVAQTPLKKYFQVAYTLGMLCFLYFFFYMGAISSIPKILELGPNVFLFTATIVAVHGIILFGIGYLLKADLATIFIASQSAIGGPSTSVALAEANGWYHMVVPGIVVGVLGYAIANYIGIFTAQIAAPWVW